METTDTPRFPAEMLNAALNLSLEWGANWLVPIQPRVRELYPELSAQEADDLNAWCCEVKKYAFALVGKDYPLVLENKTGMAIERVKLKYSQIDGDNLARLYNQGIYYAWHG